MTLELQKPEREVKDNTVSAKVPEHVKKRLQKMAEDDDRTISYFVNKFIEMGMKQFDDQQAA
jgi:predicted DNA-binding protein